MTIAAPDADPAQPWLGGRLLDLANHDVQALAPGDTVFDAARVMASQRLSFVAVLDENRRPLGVVTESQLLAAVHGPHGPQQRIDAVMQPALCVPHRLDAGQGFQRSQAAGGAPLLLLDDDGRVLATVGEGEFRARMQLALLAGRHRVSTVMARVIRPLSPRHTLEQAIEQMRNSTGTAVVITENERAVGVLTSRDVARLVAARAEVEKLPLGDVMSRPVLSLPMDASINEAAERMLAGRTRHLVVLDTDERVVGVLDEHELTRAMAVQMMDAGIEQERQRQRAVLDAIPDLVWMKDPQGVYLTCNPRFEQFLGATEAQIRGRSDHDFVPQARAEAFRRNDVQAMNSGGPHINEELITFASDGHQELVQIIKTPVRDGQGRLLGVLGIGRDITALRQAEDEYRWLFGRNPAPMFLYERASLALLRVNEAFCSQYGYSSDQARTLRLTDLYPSEDRDQVRALAATLRGLVNVGEWRHLRFDGSVIHVMAQSHDIRIDGRDCRIVVVTDVTSIKRSQQRDSQRLALMERLARGDSQQTLFEQLVLDHEALFPHGLCSLLVTSADGRRLMFGAGPSLPDYYRRALDGLPIGRGRGSCATAAHLGQAVGSEDIETDPDWSEQRAQARRAGLRSCWSEPVIGSGERVLGTLAVYRREPGLPGPEEREHMQFAVQLAATAITHGSTTRALRASERQLRDILQAIPDLVWMKDTGGVYRLFNAAFARVLGRTPDLILGKRDADLTEEHIAAACEREDQQVMRTGQPLSAERWMINHSTGEHLLAELINSPLVDEDGQPVGVLGVARDITLIKQGAVAVAEQQRLIDTMFGQTTDSIVLVDPDRMSFVTYNDAAFLGLGYTREAFAQLSPAQLRVDHDREQVLALHARAMAGEQLSFESRHRRADGGVQEAAVTLRRISYGGRQLLSAVWRDITDSKRHAARIQRLNQSYAVLSGVNEAVVRLRDRAALFAEVCRITVQAGGFSRAWVGQVDSAGHAVRALAQAGGTETAAPGLGPVELDHDSGAIARAVRSGHHCVVRDLSTAPGRAQRPQAGSAREHRSEAVFPILPAGGERLFLAVYASSTDHFDDEQVALFGRLAQDVAFALEFIGAEQARAEAQRFREQLIESVAGLFFALEPSGRILLWNRRLEELSGCSSEELAGRPVESFFEGEERTLIVERLHQVLAQGESRLEASLRSKDGTRTPCLFVARRIDRAQGPMIVATGVDISDRVRSERELAQYRDQLENLVYERTAELEAVNARLHREDRRLRAMLGLSQRASGLDEAQLFSRGLDEILGLTGSRAGCVHSVRPGEAGLVLQAWAGAPEPPPALLDEPRLLAGEVWRGSAAQALRRNTGGAEPAMAVPVLDGGDVVMTVCAAGKNTPYDDGDQRELQGLAADLWAIVQRRRIEIALGEAKAAADAANLAKSAFLANMSHEIRTPMNAVIGFAHLLRRDPLTPRQQEHLAKITDAGQHLLQVINDILDFSKIEAHKITLEQADFTLLDSLDRVKAMQLDAARAKQLPLLVSVDPRCPAALRGDRLRLEQVLLNLLSNAVKFTSRGRIDVRVALLALEADTVQLRFEVADTGIGLTDDQQQHVFEAFAQADASTTRRFGGTGLGLAISKRLVQLMEGRIGVDSRLGEGSCFWVELPLQRAQESAVVGVAPAAVDPPPVHDQRLRGVRVLVVEDNPINQEVTSSLLGSLGALVELAASGEEALLLFDPQRHDLVLMDVQMPGMDGLRATAALRARPGGLQVPIIAMTANAFAEDRAACLAAGMNDYLSKPVEPQALEGCLLRWLKAAPDPAGVASATPASADALLHRRLQALPELDTVGPLTRMRAAWPLYLRTLRMFISHHAGDAERLAEAAQASDKAAMRALAHSLVGAAATVGAVGVLHQAQALQQRLVAGLAPAEAGWQQLADALRRCRDRVQAALDGEPAPAPGQAAGAPLPAALRAALLELQPLMAAHDTAALALFERHRAALEAALGPEARALGEQLSNFSFGAAQATLQALLSDRGAG